MAYQEIGPHDTSQSVTIAKDGTTSGALDIQNCTYVGLVIPTIDSATVRVHGSYDGSTFYPCYKTDGSGVWEIGAGVGQYFVNVTDIVQCCTHIKVVAGAAQTTAAVTIPVILR